MSKKNRKIHDNKKKEEEEITNQKDQIHLKCADDMVIRLNFIQRFNEGSSLNYLLITDS